MYYTIASCKSVIFDKTREKNSIQAEVYLFIKSYMIMQVFFEVLGLIFSFFGVAVCWERVREQGTFFYWCYNVGITSIGILVVSALAGHLLGLLVGSRISWFGMLAVIITYIVLCIEEITEGQKVEWFLLEELGDVFELICEKLAKNLNRGRGQT